MAANGGRVRDAPHMSHRVAVFSLSNVHVEQDHTMAGGQGGEAISKQGGGVCLCARASNNTAGSKGGRRAGRLRMAPAPATRREAGNDKRADTVNFKIEALHFESNYYKQRSKNKQGVDDLLYVVPYGPRIACV